MRHRARWGFSLIELLVAAAILSILLAVLANVFVGTSRGYRASEASATTLQRAQIAASLLTYEVGLAGYRGVGASFATNAFPSPTQTLLITRTSGIDEIRTRYYEDRYQQDGTVDTTLRDVTYGVSGGNLVRTEAGRGSWPALVGVTSLATDTITVGGAPVALEIAVTLADGYVTRFNVDVKNVDLADTNQVTRP